MSLLKIRSQSLNIRLYGLHIVLFILMIPVLSRGQTKKEDSINRIDQLREKYRKYVDRSNLLYDAYINKKKEEYRAFMEIENNWRQLTLEENDRPATQTEIIEYKSADEKRSFSEIVQMKKLPGKVHLPGDKSDFVPAETISEIDYKINELTPDISPINSDEYRVSAVYGERTHPIFGTQHFHVGLDLAAIQGTQIYSTQAGTVIKAGFAKGYGNYIIIKHGRKYKTVYAHLKDILVKKNQKVKKGEIIGTVGSTGNSTGPHLHYEIIVDGKKVDPSGFFNKPAL